MQYTLKEAINKLENYCSYQDRCHYEVEQKLWDTETPQHLHDEVLMHLINKDYLNEERFAQSFVRGKFLLNSANEACSSRAVVSLPN